MGSPGRRSRGALGEGKGGGLCGRRAPLVSLTLPPGLVLATRCWSGECLIGSIDLGAPDSRPLTFGAPLSAAVEWGRSSTAAGRRANR